MFRFALCLSLGLALQASAGTSGDVVLPDPAGGQINGRVAMLFWPSVVADNDITKQRLLPADNCEVHLVPHDDRDMEVRHPCGKWIQPPAGGYNFWLERQSRISSTPNVLWFPDAPFTGRGMAMIDVLVDAGRVGVQTGRSLPDKEALRLVSVDSHLRWGGRGRIFERRVSAKNARAPVLMPAGQVVMGRFDERSGDAIALSRPMPLEAGKTLLLWPSLPATGSDILLVLEKPPLKGKQGVDPPALQIEERRADVLIDGHGRVIAMWYGIDTRKAKISLSSRDFFWEAREVLLRPGSVTTVRSSMQPLPKVSVQINAPDGTLLDHSLLTVSRPAESTPLRQIDAAVGLQEMPDLPADLLRVTLHLGEWRFSNDVDLRSGRDGNTSFDLEPVVLSGRVYHGDEPVRAEIGFRNAQEWVKFQADDSGRYHATLWYPGQHTVRISIGGRSGPPWIEAFKEITKSSTVDFHVPRTHYSVRVRDSRTSGPVVGALAIAGNVWVDDSSIEQTVVLRSASDDSGSAVLPPLRKGRLELQVRAEGYAESDPIHMVVEGDEKDHEIEVKLLPLRQLGRLTLVLSNGAPAAGAEIWSFVDGDPLQPVWKGVATTDGTVEMPEVARGTLLLVRHPGSASTIRRWNPEQDRVQGWNLSAPAPPLTIAITTPNGTRARSAHLALWLDGVKIYGVPLAIASWSIPASDANGVWIGRNLPPQPTQFLALEPRSGVSVESKLFDSMAVAVHYPWPSTVFAVTAN